MLIGFKPMSFEFPALYHEQTSEKKSFTLEDTMKKLKQIMPGKEAEAQQ
jgi:hypothetical protein